MKLIIKPSFLLGKILIFSGFFISFYSILYKIKKSFIDSLFKGISFISYK